MSRWFFATVVTAIEQELRAAGYHLLLITLDGQAVELPGCSTRCSPNASTGSLLSMCRPLTPIWRCCIASVCPSSPSAWPWIAGPGCTSTMPPRVRTAITHLIGLGPRDRVCRDNQHLGGAYVHPRRAVGGLPGGPARGGSERAAGVGGRFGLDRRRGRPQGRADVASGAAADGHSRGLGRDGHRRPRGSALDRPARARGPVGHGDRRPHLRGRLGAVDDSSGCACPGTPCRVDAAGRPARRGRTRRSDRGSGMWRCRPT